MSEYSQADTMGTTGWTQGDFGLAKADTNFYGFSALFLSIAHRICIFLCPRHGQQFIYQQLAAQPYTGCQKW